MDDRVPSDAEIEDAVRLVIRRCRKVESQKELHRLVCETLSTDDEKIRLTASRVRRVAVASGAASVQIDYRDTSRPELPDICPVCRGGMSPVYSMNLDGARVELRRNCAVCSYTASGKARMPARYAFVRPPSGVAESVDRLRALKKAEAYLRMAKKLVTKATEGTGTRDRAEKTTKTIDELISSRDDPSSIKNLKADIKEDEGPLWTRPLDSPKKAHGKDI